MTAGHAAGISLRGFTLLLASAFTLFAMAAVAPTLPAIERDYAGLPDAALLTRMVLTLPALTIALTAPLSGWIVDRVGRRPALLGALAAYLVSGTAAIWLTGLEAILVSRAVLGIAIGMMLTALTTLIGDNYEGAARNRMAGAQHAVMVTGVAVGTILAGFLAEYGWRTPFYMYFAVLGVIPLVWLSVTEPARDARAHAPERGLLRPGTRFSLLPVALLYLLAWMSTIGTFIVPSQLAFLLIEIGVPDPGIAGMAIAVFNIFAAATSFSFRRLRERFDNRQLLAIAYLGLGSGVLLAAAAPSGMAGAVQAMAGMLVAGLGFGVLMPTFNAWVLALAPLHLRGRLVGGVMMSQFFGFFCSPFWS
ncbi:MAG: MFS transporter, partial [Alphaproteobacteria bacterium]